jgi:DNA-directed RNA polymerase
MLRDEIGGKATNLVPQALPSDIYEEVANVLRQKVVKDLNTGVKEAYPWEGKITRKVTKRGVMTTPYGVTRYGLRKQLQYECEKIDKNYLGITEEIGLYYGYLSNHLFDAIGEVVVAARTAMVWLQQVAEIASQADKVIRWTTPVGFTPCQDYRRQKLLRVQTLHGGIRVKLGLWQNTVKIDKRKMSSGIAPNFVHSLDASHLMLTVNLCRENGLQNFSCVHDSYGTLAADVSQLAYYLREAFIQQYTPDVLGEFRTEVAKQIPASLREKIPAMPKKGGLDLEQVRESCYFFA